MKFIKKLIIFFSVLFLLFIFINSLIVYKAITKACLKTTSSKYLENIKNYSDYLENKYKIEKVNFKTKDNINLSGILIYRPNSKRVIIISHGYRQAKEFLAPLVDLFDQDTLFLFDFRAHGQSSGEKISLGFSESEDIKAAFNYILSNKKLENLPIYGLGFSMGSVALLKAAYEGAKFNALVLDSGFTVLEDQAKISLKNLTGLPPICINIGYYFYKILFSSEFINLNTCNLIESIKIPIFIIHSQSDKIVPVCNAFELYNKAKSKKELWIIKDVPAKYAHARVYRAFPQEYKKRLTSFFESIEKQKNLEV